MNSYYGPGSRAKVALHLCGLRATLEVRAGSAGEEDEPREVHSHPKVVQPANTGTSALTWGDEAAFWGRAELRDRDARLGACPVIPPPALDTGPHTPFPSSTPAVPAALPAPSGSPTVTDYSRDPGDRGGNIWILLPGLAGGLGGGCPGSRARDLNEFQNLRRALVWAGEGPRGCGSGLSRKVGSEPAREPFLSRWAQAGGRIMEFVQEAAPGRGWRRWPQAVAQPGSVPSSQRDTGRRGLGRNMVWFRGQPRGTGQIKFSLKFQAGHGRPGEGRMPKSTVRPVGLCRAWVGVLTVGVSLHQGRAGPREEIAE